MTQRSNYGKQNSTVGSVVPLAMFDKCLVTRLLCDHTFQNILLLNIARFQCYSTCQAASFASSTSCTFGGLFWSENTFKDDSKSLKISNHMISNDGSKSPKIQTFYLQSHLSSKSQQYDHYQEDDLDLCPDLPRALGQRCWS